MRIGIGVVSLFFFILISFFHASSFDLQINDRDICHNAICFVPAECVGGKEQVLKISDFYSSSCRFRLIIRALTASKLRVYIVFNGTEFSLKHDTEILFAIKKENDKVVATEGQYNPAFISRKIGADAVIAEFIIESKQDDIFKSVKERYIYKVSINDTQSEKSWSIGVNEVILEINHKVSCDPSLIVNSSTTFKQTEPVHPYYRDLRCKDPSSQAVVYVDSSDNAHIGADIQCDWEDGKNFVYKVTTKTGFFEHANDTFTAFCTTLPCTKCTAVSLPSKCDDCMLPTFVKSTSPSTCAELKCPGDHFDVEGKESVVAEPICIETAKNEYKWSIEGKTFDSATCSGDKQCAKVNPLKISNCDACDKINSTQDSIVCANGAQLRGSYKPDKWQVFVSIDCNKITGEWKATTKDGFRMSGISNVTIQCYRSKREANMPNSLLARISRIGVFGIGICVGVLIILLIGAGCYCLYRQIIKDVISEMKDETKEKKKDNKKEDLNKELIKDKKSLLPCA